VEDLDLFRFRALECDPLLVRTTRPVSLMSSWHVEGFVHDVLRALRPFPIFENPPIFRGVPPFGNLRAGKYCHPFRHARTAHCENSGRNTAKTAVAWSSVCPVIAAFAPPSPVARAHKIGGYCLPRWAGASASFAVFLSAKRNGMEALNSSTEC